MSPIKDLDQIGQDKVLSISETSEYPEHQSDLMSIPNPWVKLHVHSKSMSKTKFQHFTSTRQQWYHLCGRCCYSSCLVDDPWNCAYWAAERRADDTGLRFHHSFSPPLHLLTTTQSCRADTPGTGELFKNHGGSKEVIKDKIWERISLWLETRSCWWEQIANPTEKVQGLWWRLLVFRQGVGNVRRSVQAMNHQQSPAIQVLPNRRVTLGGGKARPCRDRVSCWTKPQCISASQHNLGGITSQVITKASPSAFTETMRRAQLVWAGTRRGRHHMWHLWIYAGQLLGPKGHPR